MNKNPLSRLYNFIQIKNHKWFEGFSWDDLISFNLKAPYLPPVEKIEYERNGNLQPLENYLRANFKEEQVDLQMETQKKYDKWFNDF